MPVIDLAFELQGSTIPQDYGYALFGALSRVVPQIHGDRRIGVHPIRGIHARPGRLTLVPQSRLRLRLPSEEIGNYLSLAGTRLELDGDVIEVRFPRKEDLRPSASLVSRLVTIGRETDPARFIDSVDRQLSAMGVRGTVGIVPSSDPSRSGEPTRRILRVKRRRLVGYAVQVDGLTAEESLIVQERGLGSRRRMGCGIFVGRGSSRTNA